jgi:hypothetical protein
MVRKLRPLWPAYASPRPPPPCSSHAFKKAAELPGVPAVPIARRFARRLQGSCRPPALNKRRLGKQRGAKVAQIDIARRLAHAIWHMLTRTQKFAPRGAAFRLAA